MKALGLMSGTSLDGVDVALLETDGETIAALGPARTYALSEEDRALLRQATRDAAGLSRRNDRPGALVRAEALVTDRHAEAVEAFLGETGEPAAAIDIVGFHGQTVFHDPARGLTVQIGDGQNLADRLGIAVAWDFRADDVAAGGQGAPLAPVYHRALADFAGAATPAVFLNLGGVANITYVGADGELIAFDTGPGNGPLDDWVFSRRGLAFDEDGRLAASGHVDAARVAAALSQAYFDLPPPKSLDRLAFTHRLADGLPDADGAATLVAITAASVAASLRHLPACPRAWYVSGGGRRNPMIMQALREALPGIELAGIEALGFDGDAIEAQAFAYLAARTGRSLPISFPGTTGTPAPLPGGRISRPHATG